MRASFVQQWRSSSQALDRLQFIVSTVPLVSLFAWIARESDSELVLAYVSLGVFMQAIWHSGVFRVGWSLTQELMAGTFELSVASQTPAMIVMFGKALALVAGGVLTGIASFLTVLLITWDVVDVHSPPLLLASVLVALVALTAGAFIFAPFMVLARGRGGFFNAFIVFGTAFSGFYYPISTLPQGLEVIARLLPTSWAMSAVIRSIDGSGSSWTIIGQWGIALGIGLAWLGLSYALFEVVEKRLRVTGQLAAG